MQRLDPAADRGTQLASPIGLKRHTVDHVQRMLRNDMPMLDQRDAELTILVATRASFRHEEVDDVESKADAAVRIEILDAMHTRHPVLRQDGRVRPDTLRVIAIARMEL